MFKRARVLVVLAVGISLVLIGQASSGARAGNNRMPDLAIKQVGYHPDCAGTILIEVTVENLGRGAAGTFGVGLWFFNGRETRYGPEVVNGLAAGAIVEVSWTIPYDGGFEADRAVADVHDRVREGNELNNDSGDQDEFC